MSLQGFVAVDGGSLYYERAGMGPGVVLIHPGLWDSRTWDDQFPRFAERFLTVRYDVRGYGRSTRPEPGRVYSHVDDLLAVMEAAGIERAVLVGCSMGGGIALEAALSHPDRVAALVLAASALPGFEPTPGEEAWWEEHAAGIEELVDAGELEAAVRIEMEIWAPLGVEDEAGARILQIALDNRHELTMDEQDARGLDPPAVQRLESIAVPTLVLPADHDPPTSQRASAILAERIPGARLAQIPEVDHVINVRRPDEFDRVVLEFLGQI
ncbi:MAG TPA: alpha/beta fold hydrolase [Actinomycetota bacterium]|nr:alpha/beta fold hydrolase [Actinomycetota bacterium]